MHIEIAFYLPDLVILLTLLYCLAGLIACLLTFATVIHQDSHFENTLGENITLYSLAFFVWWFVLLALHDLYREERLRKQREKLGWRSYFLSDEPKHLRGGGELDFY